MLGVPRTPERRFSPASARCQGQQPTGKLLQKTIPLNQLGGKLAIGAFDHRAADPGDGRIMAHRVQT